MTRGKYAARAKRTREDTEIQSELTGYQHHIKRLTGENAELRRKLAEQARASRKESRLLRAQLDEGLTPEIAALRAELEHQRDRANTAIARYKAGRERHGALTRFTIALLIKVTGCTGLEAMEQVISISEGGVSHQIVGVSSMPGRSSEEMRALDRARGLRSPANVTEHLRAVVEAARAAAGEMKGGEERWEGSRR